MPGSNVVEQVVYVPPKAAVVKKAKAAGARRPSCPENGGQRRTSGPHCPPGRRAGCISTAKQYFEGILPVVWEFRIGGYQVCEKWLKDRKGRTLEHDEIEHYQRTVSGAGRDADADGAD